MITELNERSRQIFRLIVDAYLDTGQPIGSGTLARDPSLDLSPATIRNVMAALESEGLLRAPHTSAGRIPTHSGLQLYVNGLMEIGDLTQEERSRIDAECQASGRTFTEVLDKAGSVLSGLSSGAGMVIAPKANKPIQQIQFVRIDPRKILCILVMRGGLVENRVMETEQPISDSALISASNYLTEKLRGKTLTEARHDIRQDIAARQTKLDFLTESLIEKGLILSPDGDDPEGHIIIRGQSRLLNDVNALEDLEQARILFEALEERKTISRLLEETENADGVQIFIGNEHKMFDYTGWSMVISPYRNMDNNIIGAIGVIGPARLNYGRIIPLVDYTAKVMSRLLSEI